MFNSKCSSTHVEKIVFDIINLKYGEPQKISKSITKISGYTAKYGVVESINDYRCFSYACVLNTDYTIDVHISNGYEGTTGTPQVVVNIIYYKN